MDGNLGLMSQAVRNDLIIPEFKQFCAHLKNIYLKFVHICLYILYIRVEVARPEPSSKCANEWYKNRCKFRQFIGES